MRQRPVAASLAWDEAAVAEELGRVARGEVSLTVARACETATASLRAFDVAEAEILKAHALAAERAAATERLAELVEEREQAATDARVAAERECARLRDFAEELASRNR